MNSKKALSSFSLSCILKTAAMTSLFDPAADAQLISRLESLQPGTQPKWGKMNASQMLAHCQVGFEVYFGTIKMKQSLMGKLFGKIAKKQLFSDNPMGKNLPTVKEFVVADMRDFDNEKAKLISLITRFATEGKTITPPIHPFFGKLSATEWAALMYKHTDHHLQQFGV